MLDQRKRFYVYAYLRSKDSPRGRVGTPYYIGKGHSYRVYGHHKGAPVPKQKCYIKYIAENLNEADAFQLEIFYIHLYGRIDKRTGCLMNFTDGGDGPSGVVQSLETRAKRSKSCIGRKHSEESLNKMRARKLSESHKQLLRDRIFSEDTRRKMSEARAVVVVKETTRKKMGDWQRGRKLPLETRLKIADSNRRRVLSEESKNKIAGSVREYYRTKHQAKLSSSEPLFQLINEN